MNGELKLGKFAEDLSVMLSEKSAQDHESSGKQDDPRTFVYDVLSREDRRGDGIFFSGEDWATRMAAVVDIDRWDRFIDPSAGIGDLLLAIARKLPLEASPPDTLTAWARSLVAVDLRSSFLEIAWTRIRALVYARHREQAAAQDSKRLEDTLPCSFMTANALSVDFKLKAGDCVIMNPPYQRMIAPNGSIVGTGMRTAAALHVEHMVKHAPEGVGIVALIPDVLRSGSSYRKFRSLLAGLVDIEQLEPVGHFGDTADVDVSMLVARTKRQDVGSQPTSKQVDRAVGTIGEIAQVRVGPVVPHRTPEAKQYYGYLTTRNVPVNVELQSSLEEARYSARLERAPFIVLRRTSSPSDKQRVRASIVAGKEQWLVENHLLIVVPQKHTLAECRRLLSSLCCDETDRWLNERIRCRHLTVSAVKDIPLREHKA